jgi:putative oxidoreductase
MKRILINTDNNIAPFLVRLALGIVLFAHGAQKLTGWFGGFGFAGSMDYFTVQRGMPWLVGFSVIIIEFFGAIAVILGAATRIWSVGIFAIMTGIILTTFNKFFFMNWFGNQPEEGYEFFLLAAGMALSLVISGGGRWSLDRWLTERPEIAARLKMYGQHVEAHRQ